MWLVEFLAFTRPLSYFDTGLSVGSFSAYELNSLVAIVLTLVLGVLALLGTRRGFDSIDIMVLVYTAWCVSIYLLMWPVASLSVSIKLVFPPITFVIFRRLIKNKHQYLRVILALALGFSIPVFVSAFMSANGLGIGKETYWTGLIRYQGIYSGIHEMGHNMGMAVFVVIMWYGILTNRPESNLRISNEERPHTLFAGFLVFLMLAAGFNLFMSSVRTVYVGVLLFLVCVFMRYGKKVLVFAVIAGATFFFLQLDVLKQQFFDIIEVYQGDRELIMAGSGRLFIWTHNLQIFAELPFVNKMTGVGIGNYADGLLTNQGIFGEKAIVEGVWNSHNDILSSLMETGAIGTIFLGTLYFMLYRNIKKLPRSYRYFFLGLFWATMVMHFLSNSYLMRFGLWQTFFIIMSGLDALRYDRARVEGSQPAFGLGNSTPPPVWYRA